MSAATDPRFRYNRRALWRSQAEHASVHTRSPRRSGKAQWESLSYGLASDGRFLMIRPVDPAPAPITVVLNWNSKLQARQ